jgi:hypothetical protein
MFDKTKKLLLSTGFFEDNSFLDTYLSLIKDKSYQSPIVGKTQLHHILPRSYYKIINAEVDNSLENVVNLLYVDHIYAHYLLALCTNRELQNSMCIAFWMVSHLRKDEFERLTDADRDTVQKLYEQREKLNHREPPNKGKKMSDAQKKKISASLMGHSVSLESRQKMRDAQLNMPKELREKITEATRNRNYTPSLATRKKQSESLMGHTVSDETRKKIGLSNKKQIGNRWVTNGQKDILIHSGDPIPDGYHFGTTRKFRWYTDGERDICVKTPEDAPEGFYRGRSNNRRSN